MADFSILSSCSQELAREGRLAEQYVYTDPDACANKLRKIAEALAKKIVRARCIPVYSRFPGGEPSFSENLEALRMHGILPSMVLDDFHRVRRGGNKGSHANDYGGASVREAQEMLAAGHRIAAWYVSYFSSHPNPGPQPRYAQTPPQTPGYSQFGSFQVDRFHAVFSAFFGRVHSAVSKWAKARKSTHFTSRSTPPQRIAKKFSLKQILTSKKCIAATVLLVALGFAGYYYTSSDDAPPEPNHAQIIDGPDYIRSLNTAPMRRQGGQNDLPPAAVDTSETSVTDSLTLPVKEPPLWFGLMFFVILSSIILLSVYCLKRGELRAKRFSGVAAFFEVVSYAISFLLVFFSWAVAVACSFVFRRCWACGGIGHLSRNCPERQRCHTCGGIGHYAACCPSRRFR